MFPTLMPGFPPSFSLLTLTGSEEDEELEALCQLAHCIKQGSLHTRAEEGAQLQSEETSRCLLWPGQVTAQQRRHCRHVLQGCGPTPSAGES